MQFHDPCIMMIGRDEMTAPPSPSFSTSPSIADSTPASLFSAMSFSSATYVKSTAEFKALKRELARSYYQQKLLKIDLERERSERLQERAKHEAQMSELQNKLKEAEHDVEFINEAEETARSDLEKLRASSNAKERDLRTEISTLKQKLAAEQDARFEAEETLAELRMEHQNFEEDRIASCDEFETLVAKWKSQVQSLQSSESALQDRVSQLELEILNQTTRSQAQDDYESLNKHLLATFSGLEEAEEELKMRRNEAERLATRIGSVMELEEALRVANVELARLRSTHVDSVKVKRSQSPTSHTVPSSSTETLKIAALTADLTSLKEQLAFVQGQTSLLKTELDSKTAALESSQNEVKQMKRKMFELEARLRITIN